VKLYFHSPNTPSWRGAQLKHRDKCIRHIFKITDNLCRICVPCVKNNQNVTEILISVLLCPQLHGADFNRVSENRMLRGMFGPKREEVAGGWRRGAS
jgi:hypothetical protein